MKLVTIVCVFNKYYNKIELKTLIKITFLSFNNSVYLNITALITNNVPKCVELLSANNKYIVKYSDFYNYF